MVRRTTPPFLISFFALAFVLTQAVALAHEIEHDLHQHDSPCALHDLTDQSGKALTTHSSPAPDIVILSTRFVAPGWTATPDHSSVYAARAPPRST